MDTLPDAIRVREYDDHSRWHHEIIVVLKLHVLKRTFVGRRDNQLEVVTDATKH